MRLWLATLQGPFSHGHKRSSSVRRESLGAAGLFRSRQQLRQFLAKLHGCSHGGDAGLHGCSHGGGAVDAAGVAGAADAADTYEQETRRIFVEWKAKYRKTYKYAGEEECRYALFKDSRRRVARSKAAGVTSSGLNGLSAHASEEIQLGHGFQVGEESYEEETRRIFAGWKAKYGKIYRDVGEEECRYRLFKGNRRLVVKLNAVAAGEAAYGLN
ncbi:hypothetical protein PR202_ga00590 [Eleusine coracana subsp. coracana]|uniref:Cathepsin propeptide inhibitor domain-containing protein n=1 Tax=Eleusine coracana subsp. coracana TaxID=191504 RepID=A0AAV5BGX2_ELECO|nr:hypothetical protein PR202_ga00590 [Eleusine coracana subsp. coracana]